MTAFFFKSILLTARGADGERICCLGSVDCSLWPAMTLGGYLGFFRAGHLSNVIRPSNHNERVRWIG